MGACLPLTQSLERLLDGVRRAPHNYEVSTLRFLDLDIEKVKREKALSTQGKERGEKNQPKIDSSDLDKVERDIIDLVEVEKKRSHEQLIDHIETYSKRIYGLELEGRFSAIQTYGMNGIAEFRAEVAKGLDELFLDVDRVRSLETSFKNFQDDHNLRRTAYYATGGVKMMLWGAISIIAIIETMANGYFLSKGSELGLIGGIGEALIIAFLNIGVAMFLGRWCVPNAVHRFVVRKLLGYLSIVGYLVFALGYNLLVAHYREAAGAFLAGGGRATVQSFIEAPLGLQDFQSWVLFGVGLLFSVVAFVEALFLDDIYPAFGRLHRRLEYARKEFVDAKADLIDELTELKNGTVEAMREAGDDLSKRRSEYESILDARQRLLTRFNSHLDHLERSANILLSTYRDSNKDSRTTDPPEHFSQTWKLQRPAEQGPTPTLWPKDQLEKRIKKTQSALSEMTAQIMTEYERAFSSYDRLRDLREDTNAEVKPA